MNILWHCCCSFQYFQHRSGIVLVFCAISHQSFLFIQIYMTKSVKESLGSRWYKVQDVSYLRQVKEEVVGCFHLGLAGADLAARRLKQTWNAFLHTQYCEHTYSSARHKMVNYGYIQATMYNYSLVWLLVFCSAFISYCNFALWYLFHVWQVGIIRRHS